MPKIVELRQDRSLIFSNFDGYKLSLDTVPLLRQDLPATAAPHKAEPNDAQYSLLHSELFSLQNLLTSDPWNRCVTYFITHVGEVMRSDYNENTGRPEALQAVYRLSSTGRAGERRIKGDYNYSMRFISEKYCVLCDGIRTLLLLDTGDRLKPTEWKQVTTTVINTGSDAGDRELMRNFTLCDCRLDIVQEQKQISLALGRVEREEEAIGAGSGGGSHYMQLHWAKWILEDGVWHFSMLDTLEGKGSLYYCAFEPRSDSLVISSNRAFQFRSQKSAAPVPPALQTEEKPQLHDVEMEVSGFSWSQTETDLVIKFDIKTGKEKSDYNIKCTEGTLCVKCLQEPLLDCNLYDKVDQDLTTWTLENNFLQVTLVKSTPTLYWSSLLADGAGPKEVLENGNTPCSPMEQQPIVNLEAPIEDCDFPMSSFEDEVKIERFNLSTKSITHTVLLGSTPPLFATSLRPGFPLALATRQDVDACLWLQQYNPSRPEEWSLRHEGNLHAFGYIQASKTQKKFIDCSPDLNYALICESHRHLFLYKAKYDTAQGLRNRNGPQVTLGKQHLITLDMDSAVGEVLGVATAPSVVTLLTEKCVLYLQIS